MSANAVIIGIDAYPGMPLTSAVRDALAFRDALLEHALVAQNEVVLLTAPQQPNGLTADWRTINAVLKEVHDRGSRLDRLYVFFAGHGLTAWRDAARSVSATALVPADVDDLVAQSNLLLNLDNFRARLERAGPREQFYFIDACRDLAFGERPANLPDLGWQASPEPSAGPTAQAVVFAVSPGGRAEGLPGGMGVFTSHLVDGLRGEGLALHYSDAEDAFVVTAESLREHARARVLAGVDGQHQWKHNVTLPDLHISGPETGPLRLVVNPPRPTLTLVFDPKVAADYTRVELLSRGDPLATPRWPPCGHGDAVPLRPQPYRFRVESDHGTATADPARIDLRVRRTATIRVSDRPPESAPVVRVGPGPASVQSTGVMRADGVLASIEAVADEPGAMVELEGRDPPYRRWEAAGRLQAQDLPAGSYTLRFRLGSEVYSDAELDLAAGEQLHVRPGSSQSPLLAEVLAEQPGGPMMISESIGPMFTSALLTVLPIVGVLPFDTTGELLRRFRHLVPPLDRAVYGGRPVRVVVAAEGHGWPVPAHEVAAGVRCHLVSSAGAIVELPMLPLVPEERGWGRIAHATAAVPGASFTLHLSSPWLGVIELAAATLPNRVTVVGLAATPDGSLDIVQHILRVPGLAYQEPVADIPYGRLVRELVLGQRLYENDDLVEQGAAHVQALRDLLFAKWTDPVLGCMAYYAWNDVQRRGLPAYLGVAQSNTGVTASNLLRHFPELPDVKVIARLAGLAGAPALEPGEVPVLARSLREAANGREDAPWLESWVAHVPPDTPWTLTWQPAN